MRCQDSWGSSGRRRGWWEGGNGDGGGDRNGNSGEKGRETGTAAAGGVDGDGGGDRNGNSGEKGRRQERERWEEGTGTETGMERGVFGEVVISGGGTSPKTYVRSHFLGRFGPLKSQLPQKEEGGR